MSRVDELCELFYLGGAVRRSGNRWLNRICSLYAKGYYSSEYYAVLAVIVGANKNCYWLPLTRVLAAVKIPDCRFYKFTQKIGENFIEARVNFRHFDNFFIGYARELQIINFRDTELCKKTFDLVQTLADLSPMYSLGISICYVKISYNNVIFKLRLLDERQRNYFEQICHVLAVNKRRLITMLNVYLPKIAKK